MSWVRSFHGVLVDAVAPACQRAACANHGARHHIGAVPVAPAHTVVRSDIPVLSRRSHDGVD
ncbi:hypothetical protein MRBLWO14_000223 [Microbacterium sp. LWO14-1.2]|uniref:hypothetical protein n=1 Tax=Microbacterium sp. LWO14-1.2 TaxID=3135263 RepID=UPI003139AE89